MNTTPLSFLPVAADLTVGDEVLSIDGTSFASARTVTAKRRLDGGDWEVSFGDGTTMRVGFAADVTLAPPF